MTLLPTRMLWSRLVSALPRWAVLIQRLRRQISMASLVEVHAVEVVLQDMPVEVEERARAAQLLQPVVRLLVGVVELLERLDQERAAAAGRVEQLDGRQLALPEIPEADEGRPLGGVEGARGRSARVGKHAAGACRRPPRRAAGGGPRSGRARTRPRAWPTM